MKTLRIEEPKASPFGRLKAGDTVTVYTKDGKTDRFVVADVQEDTLVSVNGGRYHATEIAKIERKSFSVPKTVGLSIGVFCGAFVLWIASAIAAYAAS
jgi:hypothetical protein